MFSKLRSLIFKFDPETAHNLAIKSLKFNFVSNIFDENKNHPMFQTNLFGTFNCILNFVEQKNRKKKFIALNYDFNDNNQNEFTILNGAD